MIKKNHLHEFIHWYVCTEGQNNEVHTCVSTFSSNCEKLRKEKNQSASEENEVMSIS